MASHVVKQRVETGKRVRVIVRNVKDKQIVSIKKRLQDEFELVEADLTQESSWLRAVEGSACVIQNDSYVPIYIVQDENEAIKHAVSGVSTLFNGVYI